MKNFQTKTVEEKELVSKTCDKCGKVVDTYSLDDEVVSINHQFGYGSELDGTSFDFDLCSGCFVKMIDGFGVKYRKSEPGYQ